MSRHTNEYEDQDRRALRRALLALHVCPDCRRDLRPAPSGEAGVWACVTCDHAWSLEPGGATRWGPAGWESGPTPEGQSPGKKSESGPDREEP